MTTSEYNAAMATLGLPSAYALAPILGIARRSSQMYAAGALPVPEPVARLLTMLLRHGIPEEWRATGAPRAQPHEAGE